MHDVLAKRKRWQIYVPKRLVTFEIHSHLLFHGHVKIYGVSLNVLLVSQC